ncbi:hypothetical protein BCR35DRAFT_182494 [Leucosporidium creatinivorum]|uniref:Uncharacterized protein n=1 Tax=Leucosporidium creatinivorum TaxID=106004 RepID=A0A1Y2E4Y9_9BASI|nr:hypothetical protein BCR35DRAFT_182494 [Leucosporidium creatinivorum]
MAQSTPLRTAGRCTYEYAPPPTPRSASAIEIKNRHQLQASTTLAISNFSSLLADLTASYSDTGSHLAGGGRVTERTRLDRIESFREDWMVGALMRVIPPALLPEGEEETFSDGTRYSLGGGTASSVASDGSPCPLPLRPRYVPFDPLERGVIAEKTIKADLTRRNALLVHEDFASLPRMAQRAIRRTLRTGKAVYVAPGLLVSPSWVKEYEQQGWARPGIRWGNFKPDLIRFEEVKTKGSAEGEPRVVSFEVVEIKYQGQSGREVASPISPRSQLASC